VGLGAVAGLDHLERRLGDDDLLGLEDVARVDVVEGGKGQVGDVASLKIRKRKGETVRRSTALFYVSLKLQESKDLF